MVTPLMITKDFNRSDITNCNNEYTPDMLPVCPSKFGHMCWQHLVTRGTFRFYFTQTMVSYVV